MSSVLFAILPPMPLELRLVLGFLGTLFAATLNLFFRGAKPRWWEFPLAFVISPLLIYVFSQARWLNSGQRTEYVFWGAVVGIACVRGTRSGRPIPRFGRRALIVFVSFVVLGPVVGLLFHWLRFQFGVVQLNDSWEIQLSIDDGIIASIVGAILAVIMIVSSVRSAAMHGAAANKSVKLTGPARQVFDTRKPL